MRVCSEPGCPLLTPKGTSRCPDHKPKATSGTQTGYDSKWRKIRKQHLKYSPHCVHCLLLGKTREATDVDHIIELKDGGTNDWENLQSLCRSHHQRKTQRAKRARK